MKVRVIEQHAEEAAFLWMLRCEAVHGPRTGLAALADLDGRVEAHLDGLRIAGDAGWTLCRRNLIDFEEPGEVFAAASIALASPDGRRIDEVLEIAGAAAPLERAVVSAIAWASGGHARAHLDRLLGARPARLRRVGIAASAARREDPGSALDRAIHDGDPRLVARAVRAAGELGRADLRIEIARHLDAGDAELRVAAAWSAARLGDQGALAVLAAEAERGGRLGARAAEIALRRMRGRPGRDILERIACRADGRRAAVIAAAALGDPEVVPWLIEWMRDPRLSRVAGHSFTMITGVDLTVAHMCRARPDDAGAGPSDDPRDERVAMDPDRDLPWPDPAALHAFWTAYRGLLLLGARYLLGRPITARSLAAALAQGPQPARAAAAIERALRHPREPLFEVRAPGFRQRV